jgi:hypothetical protein
MSHRRRQSLLSVTVREGVIEARESITGQNHHCQHGVLGVAEGEEGLRNQHASAAPMRRWLLTLAAAFTLSCSTAEGRDTPVDSGLDREGAAVMEADATPTDVSSDVSAMPTEAATDSTLDLTEGGTTDTGECGAVGPDVYPPDAGNENACSSSKPCTDGLVCVGDNCDTRWKCETHASAAGEHPCPTNIVAYCGCDDVTFFAFDTCPDRPYQHIGACDDGFNCDPTDLRCSEVEPTCAEGEIASVVHRAYGECVPFSFCRCEFVWECPHRDKYQCDRPSRRCRAVP